MGAYPDEKKRLKHRRTVVAVTVGDPHSAPSGGPSHL